MQKTAIIALTGATLIYTHTHKITSPPFLAKEDDAKKLIIKKICFSRVFFSAPARLRQVLADGAFPTFPDNRKEVVSVTSDTTSHN